MLNMQHNTFLFFVLVATIYLRNQSSITSASQKKEYCKKKKKNSIKSNSLAKAAAIKLQKRTLLQKAFLCLGEILDLGKRNISAHMTSSYEGVIQEITGRR